MNESNPPGKTNSSRQIKEEKRRVITSCFNLVTLLM